MSNFNKFLTTAVISTALLTSVTASASTPKPESSKVKTSEFSPAKCGEKKSNWLKKATEHRTTKNTKQAETLAKTTEIVSKLKTAGKDTTKADQDLVSLKTDIEAANASNLVVVKQIEAISCADKDAHKTSIEKVKVAQAAAQKSNQLVREYIKNTVRPDIKAVKK